jgi:hypothetical protein
MTTTIVAEFFKGAFRPGTVSDYDVLVDDDDLSMRPDDSICQRLPFIEFCNNKNYKLIWEHN